MIKEKQLSTNPAAIAQRNWRLKNAEHYREYCKEFYKKHRTRIHSNRFARETNEQKKHYAPRSSYGIGFEDYIKMLTSQNGCCAICKSTEYRKSDARYMAVDHDHITGKVRGLLCNHCNRGLGAFRDNLEFMKQAILYLEQSGK